VARRAGELGRAATRLTGAVLAALVAASGASAQAGPPGAAETRLRAADRLAAILLETGQARSATFGELAAVIERSDLIVYVETRPGRLPGQLQFVAATPTCRFLRVSVRTPGLPREQIAWLAHELRHAVEIAGAPEIREQASLRRYYERAGDGGRYGNHAESPAAQAAGLRVSIEMRGR